MYSTVAFKVFLKSLCDLITNDMFVSEMQWYFIVLWVDWSPDRHLIKGGINFALRWSYHFRGVHKWIKLTKPIGNNIMTFTHHFWQVINRNIFHFIMYNMIFSIANSYNFEWFRNKENESVMRYVVSFWKQIGIKITNTNLTIYFVFNFESQIIVNWIWTIIYSEDI